MTNEMMENVANEIVADEAWRWNWLNHGEKLIGYSDERIEWKVYDILNLKYDYWDATKDDSKAIVNLVWDKFKAIDISELENELIPAA